MSDFFLFAFAGIVGFLLGIGAGSGFVADKFVNECSKLNKTLVNDKIIECKVIQ